MVSFIVLISMNYKQLLLTFGDLTLKPKLHYSFVHNFSVDRFCVRKERALLLPCKIPCMKFECINKNNNNRIRLRILRMKDDDYCDGCEE